MKHSEKNTYLDLCVCCGSIIPEGRMVCTQCEKQLHNEKKESKKIKAKRKK